MSSLSGESEWDLILGRFPEATYFHTRAWGRLVTRAFPHCRDVSRRWIDPTTGAEHRVPLYAWSRVPLLTTLQSSFPFLYGGPVPALGPDGQPVLPRLARALAQGDRSLHITANPFAPGTDVSAPGYAPRVDYTHLRALPATDSEFWDDELTPARRNDVRRLSKKGVAIEETQSERDVEAVYGLYLGSFQRWGGRPAFVHPLSFYQELARDSSVRLTVARQEGRILGGTFAVRWNEKVHYLAGYFDSEARALRPNVLLQIESIRRAIADGFAWYDFLPSGGHAAVEEFKEGFGGRRRNFTVLERRGRWHRWRDRLRRSSAPPAGSTS